MSLLPKLKPNEAGLIWRGGTMERSVVCIDEAYQCAAYGVLSHKAVRQERDTGETTSI